jgi:indolepyruvate ferredoxin oxidoreductase
MMEMAGLAQKGGAVHIHCRIAARPEDITAVRVATGEADAVIGGDLVVTAGAKTIGLMTTGRTGAVVNDHDIVTGEFTRNVDFRIPNGRLRLALEARLQGRVAFLDATELARVALGDSIFSNMIVFGAAWQQGLIPVSHAAIAKAIELNGAGARANLRAFDLGRWAVLNPAAAAAAIRPPTPEAVDPVAFRADHLRAYRDEALADRYLAFVGRFPAELRESVARGYHKLLAIKDEYEVARLHLSTLDKAKAEFDGALRPTFWLAPPLLPGKDAAGRPKKRAFGAWMVPVFRQLARMKHLRGTRWDVFGRTAERRMERALIAEYEGDMARALAALSPATLPLVRELAELPLTIRGFGPVKEANAAKAAERRAALLARLDAGRTAAPIAAE